MISEQSMIQVFLFSKKKDHTTENMAQSTLQMLIVYSTKSAMPMMITITFINR
jgi:hypothetical protein